MFGDIFDHYDLSGGCGQGGLLLEPRGWRPETPLHIAHCTGQPSPVGNYPPKMSTVLKLRTLLLDHYISISWGFWTYTHRHHTTGLDNLASVALPLAPLSEEEPSTVISML